MQSQGNTTHQFDANKHSLGGTSGAGGPNQTLSTLANYPRHKIVKLVSESRPLIGGARKCKQIWQSIRKADFRKEGVLNETNIRLVFDSCKQQIYDLLRIQAPAEFLEVFDQGGDGQLNEDEQILIFSLVKEKMQVLADELCIVHEYQLYKDLMREVRLLEVDIGVFQDELRKNIQENQLREYVDIGDEKLQEFYREWERKFAEFGDESLMKIEELKFEHEEQMDMLNVKLDRAVEALKIKPSAKLKEMQNNEKLVAVNERVEEAMNYRKELKILEIKEAQRIENLRQKNAANQRKFLLGEQQKELHQLEAKIETGRHALQITQDKDLIILQKEINLHVADIQRIQGLMSRLAMKKCTTTDELRRIKDKSRKTQAFLSESKKVVSSTIPKDTQGVTMTSPDKSKQGTMMSGGGSTAASSTQGSMIVEMILFGANAMNKRGISVTQSSFNNTMTSSSNNSSPVPALRYIVKNLPITTYEISVTNADGTRRTDEQMQADKEENAQNQGGHKKKKMIKAGGKSNAFKIQFLLDQRKPPTEQLPSLCDQYDDDLNHIEGL